MKVREGSELRGEPWLEIKVSWTSTRTGRQKKELAGNRGAGKGERRFQTLRRAADRDESEGRFRTPR